MILHTLLFPRTALDLCLHIASSEHRFRDAVTSGARST
jgi:hypothetical protein